MPILKNKTPGSFVMIGKDILKNTDLKLVDRGMLATLLSLPDKWDFSVVGLAKILPEGKSAIQASLSRLEHSGYLTRTQERGEHGKYGDTFLEVHQVPISPCTEICVRIIGIPKSRMQKNGIPKTCHNLRIKHRIIMN